MSTIITLVALSIVLLSTPSKGINPVQHSERAASQNSKGINPVQHSE
ncbi:MAG TPA: hypothetical protein VIQ24_04600 [Pyrinomonadaceae bacterium]